MDSAIENERIKLTANAFDRLSTALATVGAIAPLATLIYGNGPLMLSAQFSIVAVVCWLMAASALHLIARYLLGGLSDDSI